LTPADGRPISAARETVPEPSPMPDQISKPHRGPFPRAAHDSAVRGADQDARLAAELRRNLLRRKQQQRARADGSPAGEDGDGSAEGEANGGGRHKR
jgi:hypothetical protein